ncbi:gp53-like domain-containing protein [Dialister succinatiphilus]
MCRQGGYGSVGQDQTATFTYPVSFPYAVIGALLGRAYSAHEVSPTITNLQKSYMQWTSKGAGGASYGANTFFTVIGY